MAAAKKNEEKADDKVTVATVEGDETEVSLPSVKDANVITNEEVGATSDAADPGKSWTVQSDEPYTEADVHSEGAVPKDALPSKEGLKEVGVSDPDQYLSGVVVKDDESA